MLTAEKLGRAADYLRAHPEASASEVRRELRIRWEDARKAVAALDAAGLGRTSVNGSRAAGPWSRGLVRCPRCGVDLELRERAR